MPFINIKVPRFRKRQSPSPRIRPAGTHIPSWKSCKDLYGAGGTNASAIASGEKQKSKARLPVDTAKQPYPEPETPHSELGIPSTLTENPEAYTLEALIPHALFKPEP